MKKVQQIKDQIKESVTKNFRHATVNFIFIILFVNVFQAVFGAENSIVGVIFTIMMAASMARDLTAMPVKHLLTQTVVLFLITAAACFVSNVNPIAALPVNLVMIFIILYAYTFEYSSHLYFPYLLSYLFLVFITPAAPEQLPKRLLGVFAGTVCMILYQLVNGRKRIAETTHDVLGSMIDQAQECIQCLLTAGGIKPEQLREDLCKLIRIVYDRRKGVLCISDAGFAIIDTGRELENLVLMLYGMEGPVTPERAEMLSGISACLNEFRSFALGQAAELPSLEGFAHANNPEAEELYRCLRSIRLHMGDMTEKKKRRQYRKTLLSVSTRLKAALRISPVRIIYALRVSCLLALCTLLVQLLELPHGKWLLFTVASVSLPYADDVAAKAKKRMAATLIGGLFSVVVYALIPGSVGRTAVMMLSGYLSFYFADYSATFACSTVGALGGAVFMGAFGWGPVGTVLLVRLGYVLLGILVALLFNLVFFPFRRNRATRRLVQKYRSTSMLLSEVCRHPDTDAQLYYGLVVQAYLQEDKLCENARELNWDGAKELLEECREKVRMAHRDRMDSFENTRLYSSNSP